MHPKVQQNSFPQEGQERKQQLKERLLPFLTRTPQFSSHSMATRVGVNHMKQKKVETASITAVNIKRQ